jgi:signal transduction histidine kinase/ligand-binding sensor domain-containing protein
MILRFIFFILLIGNIPFTVWGQVQGFTHVEAPSEINNLEIFCTYQDNNGLMWLGTSNGLFSYDGYNFKHFENPIEGEFSVSTIQEVNNKLWIGVWRDSGLWLFDKASEQFTNAKDVPGFAPFFANLFCVRKIILEDNTVWLIATLHQRQKSVLVKYDLENKHFNYFFFKNPPHIERLEFNSFVKTNENGREIAWIATHSNGLYEFDIRSRKLTTHLPGPNQSITISHHDIRYVYVSPSESALWIGTKWGLNKMSLSTRKVTNQYFSRPGQPDNLSDDHIWTILEVNRKLWVATENGLNRIDLTTNQVKQFRHVAKDPTSIRGSYIRGLYQCQGMLWITSFGAGINQMDLRPTNFAHITLSSEYPDGLIGSSVTALCPGKDEGKPGVWIGTENGLFFLDKQSQKLKKHVASVENPIAFHSILSLDNSLWLETSKGFKKYDVASKTLTNSGFGVRANDSLSHNTWFINSFSNDPYGMWMGSWEQGLTYLQTKTRQAKNYPSALLNPTLGISNKQAILPVKVEYHGKKYIYFISTIPYISAKVQTVRNCLVRLDPATNEYTYYTQDPKKIYSLGANYITSLHNSGDSVLWMGTYKSGLEKFDIATGRFTHFKEKQGINTSSIFTVSTDYDGNVWMSTDKGISKLTVATGQVNNFRGSFLEGNFWMVTTRDESGTIYYGSNQGLIFFNPDSVRVNPYPPPTVITSFKVLDKELSLGGGSRKQVSLAHTQNFFSFEFAALNYRQPERNMYAYQLTGVDKNWNYSGSRRYVSYANLEPGEYEFRVKSCNNDGIWNPQWTSVYITIAPPWWASWWFRLLLLVGTGLAMYGTYRFRIKALKNRQQQLERQVRSRTSEIIRQKEEIAVQQEQLTHMNEYLKLLSDTLEDRVHARTAELLKANEELRQKNEEIQQALVTGQTLERKRVAAELHDNLGGLLSAVKLNLEILNAEHLSEPERKLYENVLAMVSNACLEVRNISHHMLPEVLEKYGLEAALQRYVYSINTARKIHLELDLFGLDKRLDKQIEASIYPICVELITNILKHAQATTASLQIVHSQNEISVIAQDNGKGLHPEKNQEGMGLQNIQSRIEAMRGTYRVDSVPEKGTTITIDIPLKKRKGKSVNLS